MKLLLDTTVVSKLCSPFRPENQALTQWFNGVSREGDLVCLPEITDYETRRGLLHIALRSGQLTTKSLRHLDGLSQLLTYLPVTTSILRQAASLWAEARCKGLPTGSSLDADVILAAQALAVPGSVVVTDNLKHLARFVPACRWQDIPLS